MKHIVITGAGRGIGRATAEYLLSKGHKVHAVSRNTNNLDELKVRYTDDLYIYRKDLTDKKEMNGLVASWKSEGLRIDGLINNAGVLINRPFGELTDEETGKMWEVNYHMPVRLIRMLETVFKGGSHIVNIGSMGGYQGSQKFPGLSEYSSGKAALAVMTECIAEEWKDKGIRSNCLALGAVNTDMLKAAFPGYTAPVSEEEMGEFIGEFVLRGHLIYNGKVLPVSLSTP
jgi:NAD(P)-dependent dehydrogenase (short-subunit alcohol dehydrogenase family)